MPAIGRLRYLEALPPPAASAARRRGTLLLLHAFPLSARMWESQLALAASGWHVLAPHMRGVDEGEFADPAKGLPPVNSMDDYAADVIDLLDGLHIDDAVIAGLSMGGYLAFALFRHTPSYFSGLVLADTRSQGDTPEGLEARRRMLKLLDEKGPPAVADEMIPKLLGASTRASRPDVVERVRALILSNSKEAIAGSIRALMSRPDSTPLLASIRVPTLIIVGEEDQVTPPAAAEEMHARISGSELVRIPQAGHLSNVEQTATFNAALARFLEHRV